MTPTRRIRIAAAALLLQLTTLPSLALDAAREDVRVFVDDMERAHGLDRAWVGKLMDAAASQPRIIELMSRPAERTKPWHEYRDHFLTEARIAAGAGFWAEHRQRLAAVEAATGVPAHVIVGILGVETFYGRITGNFRVLDALSTLAFDYPPRSSYFRGELEQFLLLSREEDVPPLTVKGSYAGAMGYPQFMPLRTFTNVNTGSMTVNVEYPMDTKAWPVFNTATNERAIAVSVGFIVYSGTLSWKFTSYQWWVKCLPPLPPFEGCTPGYWKQEQHFDSWVPTGLQTTDLYGPLFGITPSFSPNTLLDALGLGGGGGLGETRARPDLHAGPGSPVGAPRQGLERGAGSRRSRSPGRAGWP